MWLQFPLLRAAITNAQALIDRQLSSGPATRGFHVSEGLYAIEAPPLRAQFEMMTELNVVRVVSLMLRR